MIQLVRTKFDYLILVLAVLLVVLGVGGCQEREVVPINEPPEPVVKDTAVVDSVVPIASFSLLQPANQAYEAPVSPRFEWQAASGAQFYRLLVATDEALTQPVLEQNSLTDNFYTTDQPLATKTTYYWQVTAVNADTVVMAKNGILSFETGYPVPAPSPGIATHYVAPNGKDAVGYGTQAQPFKTLAFAARMVPANEDDTIYLAPGVYEETEPIVLPLRVHIKGAGEDQVTLLSAGVTVPPSVNQSNKDYKKWHFGALIQLMSSSGPTIENTQPPVDGAQSLSGFTIDGQNKQLKAGIWMENRHNVHVHHVTVRDVAQRGAVFASGYKPWFQEPNFYVEGLKVHDCTFINSGKDLEDESTGNINIAQLAGAELYNITIRDNEGYGIKFMYDGYYENTVLHHLDIELSESDALWGEDIAIELWNAGPGNKIHDVDCNTWLSIVSHPNVFDQPDSTENVEVYNVRIIDQDANSNKEGIEVGTSGVEVHDVYVQNKGIGVAIWNAGYNNVVVRNSIFYNSGTIANWAGNPAIYIDNSKAYIYEEIRIINNVFDTNGYGVRIKGQNIERVEIKNNIFLNSRVAEVQAVGKHIVFEHNLKGSNSQETWTTTGITEESDNLVGDPGFVASGDRENMYYRPAAASSLMVDQGTDVGMDFRGTAPDIGYWEY